MQTISLIYGQFSRRRFRILMNWSLLASLQSSSAPESCLRWLLLSRLSFGLDNDHTTLIDEHHSPAALAVVRMRRVPRERLASRSGPIWSALSSIVVRLPGRPSTWHSPLWSHRPERLGTLNASACLLAYPLSRRRPAQVRPIAPRPLFMGTLLLSGLSVRWLAG